MTMTMTKKWLQDRRTMENPTMSLSLSLVLYVIDRHTNKQTEKSEKASSQNMKRHLHTLQGYERWNLEIEERQRVLLHINLTRSVDWSATRIAIIWLHYVFLHYLFNQPYSIQSCIYPLILVLKRMLSCHSSKTFSIKIENYTEFSWHYLSC